MPQAIESRNLEHPRRAVRHDAQGRVLQYSRYSLRNTELGSHGCTWLFCLCRLCTCFRHVEKLPRALNVFGFARSARTDSEFRDTLRSFLKGDDDAEDQAPAFLERCFYRQGSSYDDTKAFSALIDEAAGLEGDREHPACLPAARSCSALVR